MRRALSLMFFALTIFSLPSITLAETETPAPEPVKPSAQLKNLLRQRRDTLRLLVKTALLNYQAKRETSLDSVLRASEQLRDAELELAKDRQDRIAIYQERVKLMKLLEEIAEDRLRVGLGSREDFLAASAASLQAQIQLIREQNRK